MKPIIMSAMLAISMLSSSFAVQAEPRHAHSARHYSGQHHSTQYQSQAHRGAERHANHYRAAARYSNQQHFRQGGQLPPAYWNQHSHVNNWHQHSRLYAPPRGYAWYHADDRYVLAAVATGLISAIVLSH